MKSIQETYTLLNNTKIPIVGFGTWQTPNDDIGYKAILEALKLGYRHIDTATAYRNEECVGRAIKDSDVPREELFITTKLWNAIRGYEETLQAINDSLTALNLDYIDLYLIHWPNPKPYRDQWEAMNAESWRAIEEMYKKGKLKAIGISNFEERHIDALLKTATIPPMVNQLRLCPGDRKEALVSYCREKNILLEAYSPLGTGKVFDVPELIDLADKYSTSVAKLSLRWSLQMGFLPLPKSITPERIQSNAELFDFEISMNDMDLINNLVGCCGLSDNPDEKPF